MNCKSYQSLSEQEQVEFIGYLVHVATTTETGFMAARMMIEAAQEAGKLDHVKIGHRAVYGENNLLTVTA